MDFLSFTDVPKNEQSVETLIFDEANPLALFQRLSAARSLEEIDEILLDIYMYHGEIYEGSPVRRAGHLALAKLDLLDPNGEYQFLGTAFRPEEVRSEILPKVKIFRLAKKAISKSLSWKLYKRTKKERGDQLEADNPLYDEGPRDVIITTQSDWASSQRIPIVRRVPSKTQDPL
jgi:hypothetical protein